MKHKPFKHSIKDFTVPSMTKSYWFDKPTVKKSVYMNILVYVKNLIKKLRFMFIKNNIPIMSNEDWVYYWYYKYEETK